MRPIDYSEDYFGSYCCECGEELSTDEMDKYGELCEFCHLENIRNES